MLRLGDVLVLAPSAMYFRFSLGACVSEHLYIMDGDYLRRTLENPIQFQNCYCFSDQTMFDLPAMVDEHNRKVCPLEPPLQVPIPHVAPIMHRGAIFIFNLMLYGKKVRPYANDDLIYNDAEKNQRRPQFVYDDSQKRVAQYNAPPLKTTDDWGQQKSSHVVVANIIHAIEPKMIGTDRKNRVIYCQPFDILDYAIAGMEEDASEQNDNYSYSLGYCVYTLFFANTEVHPPVDIARLMNQIFFPQRTIAYADTEDGQHYVMFDQENISSAQKELCLCVSLPGWWLMVRNILSLHLLSKQKDHARKVCPVAWEVLNMMVSLLI